MCLQPRDANMAGSEARLYSPNDDGPEHIRWSVLH